MAAHHKARPGQRWAMAALLVCLTAAPALAQNVPLPIPRPAPNAQPNTTGSIVPRPANSAAANSAAPNSTAAKPAIPAEALGARAQAPQAQTPKPFNPFAGLFDKPSTANNPALKPEQRATIERVNNYLSGMKVLSGRFVQVGPDGGRTQGEFHISKPGKVRFEYDDPSPIQLIADGQSVVVRDRRLATQDVYPLSQTPLRFLLADHVDLMKDSNLVAVYADADYITVMVEEKNGIVGTSRLMIMFSAKDMQLKQWTVTDPQGYDTTVAVYNLDTSKRPDPGMFKIDYTNYHN
jgi:outer membrane lipoprotein-sorting protein